MVARLQLAAAAPAALAAVVIMVIRTENAYQQMRLEFNHRKEMA